MKKHLIILSLVLTIVSIGYLTFSRSSSISSLFSDNVKAYSEGEDFSKMRHTFQYVFSEFTLHFEATETRTPSVSSLDINDVINSITEVHAGLNIDFLPALAIIISCKNALIYRNCDPRIIGVWQASSDYTSLEPVRLAYSL